MAAFSHDGTSPFAQRCFFVSLQVSKSSWSNEWGDKQKRLEFSEYCSKQREGYSEYLSKNCFFWWMHVRHQPCCQQAKRNNLRIWASIWAQTGGYDHSRCYDMVCHIRRTFHTLLFFRGWERYAWELPKYTNSLHVLRLHVIERKQYFSAKRCSPALFKPSCNLFEQQLSKDLSCKGWIGCLASMLSWSNPLQFPFGGSYRIKATFTPIGSMKLSEGWNTLGQSGLFDECLG